ncbi:MAG: tetratricopeptide repeat protein [Bdellovibrionales bacterium]|nr:tetratricopeptide repeat protein [Bdellovibrionales bacterium]
MILGRLILIAALIASVASHDLSWFSGLPKELSRFQVPPKQMQYYHFGYADLTSSSLWVRLLQDIEICQNQREQKGLESLDANKDVLGQVLKRELPQSRCHLGWTYKMLDVITDLDPTFFMAYYVGGTFLSVLVDDREGAQRIYEKGLHFFPDQWKLLYAAGYHELFEMQNPEKAAELLEKAGRRGAPKWVYALAARLYTRTGRALYAKSILEAVLARDPKGPRVEQLKIRLKEINALLTDPSSDSSN